MPIKSRRYRKRNNKSRRTRKNKTTRRYKKQMKGGNGLITSEEELKKSWDNQSVKYWMVRDEGSGTTIFREDAVTEEIMPYGEEKDTLDTYPPTFRGKINHYLKKVIDGQQGAEIKEVY